MILVDTSVWIDYLRNGESALMNLLNAGEVVTHPFVIGELALGNLLQRDVILDTLNNMPQAKIATNEEVLTFISQSKLYGQGVGFIDAHLLIEGLLVIMNLKTFSLIVFVCVVISSCSDSEKANNAGYKPAEYVPDPDRIYIKIVGDRPDNMPLRFQDTQPCFLDVVNNRNATGINVVIDKSKVQLIGWAGDVPNGVSPQEVWLQFDGIRQNAGFSYIRTTSGIRRQDVADVFKKPGLTDTGWEVYADLSELASGSYDVLIVMLVNEKWLTCDTKRVIQI